MKLRYDIAVEDVVALAQHHYRSSPAVLRTRERARWSGTIWIFIGIFAVIKLSDVHANTIAATISATLIAGVWFLTWPSLATRTTERQIRQMLGEGANRGTLGEHQIEILQDGLLDKTAVGEQRIKWQGVERVESSDTHTFVYTGAYTAHVIPKAAVKEGDYEPFVLAVRQRIADVAQPGA